MFGTAGYIERKDPVLEELAKLLRSKGYSVEAPEPKHYGNCGCSVCTSKAIANSGL
jgi:hypothetical protein